MTSAHQNKALPKGPDISNLAFGKVQPQALPLEEAVLGAIMLDKDALPTVVDILRADSFYPESHQLIFKAMVRLFEKTQPIDLLTVTEELKKVGDLVKAGGPYYLVELTNRVASAANIERHARIVLQKHIQRELIRVSAETMSDAYSDRYDELELLETVSTKIYNLSPSTFAGTSSMDEIAYKALQNLEKAASCEGLLGVPSGFSDLDRLTNGWQSPDLIIIAARPGMGKTSLMLALARNAALGFGRPLAIFSLEMSKVQLVQRYISMESGVNNNTIKNGEATDEEWNSVRKATEAISKAPIYINDQAGLNVLELRAKCLKLKQQHDIQMVIIDYLQLMSGGPEASKGNREQEISAISRGLKKLAKELEIPVIALSQLSRAVETRGGNKRPKLSDLRESGAIEQDSDIVSFIYRPEYYNIVEDENGVSLKGIAEIIVAKHRNGALDTIRLAFIDKIAKFVSLDDYNLNNDEKITTKFSGSMNGKKVGY